VLQINLVHYRLEPMSQFTRAFVGVLRELVAKPHALNAAPVGAASGGS
jgi:hypothetical protein